jgi:ankyrin repeat domain-containing protein 50
MTVGRLAPRYQMMALLYPRSKNLQSHLSEYFIVVVRLCHQLLKFTQKSIFGQFASTLSDSDMKIYQSELDLWANTIKEEVNLLMAKKIEEEAEENSRFRALSSKFSKSVSLQQKIETNLRLLNICSMYDYETTWKQTRKVGNATLFNRNAEYQDWKGRADSCTLIYTGKLGSGKSVLLANIVDNLNLHIRSKNVVVAYFFCRHDTLESLKARTVIGSLARQLLHPIPDLAIVAELLDETSLALDFERIFSLLQRALPPNCKAYFILDGLDECDYAERKVLIQQLRKLQEIFTLLLCVSFRLEPNNALKLGSEQFAAAIVTSIPNDNPDIEAFIGAELESCIESKKLVIGNPALILEIQDALLEKSQGMFLWVALQIESLCAMKTDDAICQALADLPKDLSEMFSRILRRSEGLGKPYQRLILELITVAHHPLTMEELREALSVVPSDAVWNPAKLLNDIYSTLACCGSLVTVDEEELTIRLVHHSVKQFLLSEFKDSTNIAFTVASAKRKMADIIVTYLNYGVFETQLSTVVVPQIMTGSAPSRIIRSTLDSSSSVQSLALKLLKSRKRPDYDIGKTLAESSKLFSHRLVGEFHFYAYAKSYWPQYVFCISEQEPIMYNLLLRLFEGKAVNTNATDEDGQTPLLWAAQKGHEAAVKLLLERGAELETKDKDGQTPLLWAAQNGDEAVVKLLLERGAELETKDKDGQTPLLWAAQNGDEAVVKLLLERGAELETKDNDVQTPLLWAAQHGDEAVVKLLLERGAELETKDRHYSQTPLVYAAGNGHEVVVKLLLEKGAELEAKSNSGSRPLAYAVSSGHKAVVKLLLEKGAELEAKSNSGSRPLAYAASSGHEAVVKLLLEKGAKKPQ